METITVDDFKRVRIPDAEPGQVFTYETSAGTVTLTPVVNPALRRVQAKLIQKDGKLVFDVPKGFKIAENAIPRTLPK